MGRLLPIRPLSARAACVPASAPTPLKVAEAMATRNKKSPTRHTSPREAPPPMSSVHPDAAGIDIHSDLHVVCVPSGRDPDGDSVRSFGANTVDLVAIAGWLAACGVTTVAMESTGVYWIPLFELLESRGFEVFLVEPGQLSHCGARPKTDVLDAQWIQRIAQLWIAPAIVPAARLGAGPAGLPSAASDAHPQCG